MHFLWIHRLRSCIHDCLIYVLHSAASLSCILFGLLSCMRSMEFWENSSEIALLMLWRFGYGEKLGEWTMQAKCTIVKLIRNHCEWCEIPNLGADVHIHVHPPHMICVCQRKKSELCAWFLCCLPCIHWDLMHRNHRKTHGRMQFCCAVPNEIWFLFSSSELRLKRSTVTVFGGSTTLAQFAVWGCPYLAVHWSLTHEEDSYLVVMPRRAHGEWQLLAIWWSVVIVIAEAWVLQCLRHCSLVWTPFCFQQLHLYRL